MEEICLPWKSAFEILALSQILLTPMSDMDWEICILSGKESIYIYIYIYIYIPVCVYSHTCTHTRVKRNISTYTYMWHKHSQRTYKNA